MLWRSDGLEKCKVGVKELRKGGVSKEILVARARNITPVLSGDEEHGVCRVK